MVDHLRGRHGLNACMRGHDLFLQRYGEKKKDVHIPGVLVHSTNKEWVPLNFKSGYSFLDSLLGPKEIVKLAVEERGHKAVAITDPNLHGAIEFALAAKEAGIKAVIGAEISIAGAAFTIHVQYSEGYRNLCALLSLPSISRDALEGFKAGLIIRPADHQPSIRYAEPRDKALYGILSSIRTLTLLDERSPKKSTGDHHYPLMPIANAQDSVAIADCCDFEFQLGGLKFPNFHPPDGSSPKAFLRRLAMEGMRRRYDNPARAIHDQIEEELSIVGEVGYEEYFLLTWDLLWNHCHPRGIEWITRGSAADSLVCYCLGISDVCPIRFELYFRRFLNRDRMVLNKLPDIDLDFAHDRKDEVIDLIFKKYGDHAAIVGGFNTFKGRSAFADIAKVMGVSEFQIRRMTAHMPWGGASHIQEAVAQSQEYRDGTWEEDPYRTALELARRLDGMPRHPKMHPCGVVLSREPIMSMTPLFRAAMRSEIQQHSALGKFLKDANCLIPSGNLLVRAVNAIQELPLEKGDTKGDLYEYLLSKLSTAGIAGQFRTPRHIIRAMVEILDPKSTDTICDPACGTAGFLIGTMEYLQEKYSTPALIETDEDGNKHFPGDLLEPYREHIQGDMMHGFDFDATMLRITRPIQMPGLIHQYTGSCTLSSTDKTDQRKWPAKAAQQTEPGPHPRPTTNAPGIPSSRVASWAP